MRPSCTLHVLNVIKIFSYEDLKVLKEVISLTSIFSWVPIRIPQIFDDENGMLKERAPKIKTDGYYVTIRRSFAVVCFVASLLSLVPRSRVLYKSSLSTGTSPSTKILN